MICPDCLKEVPSLDKHHLVAIKDGGPDKTENIWRTCHYCHKLRHRGSCYLHTPAIEQFIVWLDIEHKTRRVVPLWEQEKKIEALGHWEYERMIEEAAFSGVPLKIEWPTGMPSLLHLMD